jgi:predicted RNase H-like nuclease (RuvC/YqgF family)
MRVKSCVTAFSVVVALCLAGLPVRAQAQGSSQQPGSDPVADAARKAREDKKTAPKPKKVFTDDDVKPANSPASSNPSGTAATAAVGAQKESDAGQTADANGEATWRKRFRDQHDKIDKAEKELDLLQREEEKSQVQYYTDPQKALTEQNTRKDINDKQAKIDAKKQEIAQLKQGLDDLEDQLRKSGGDPGWAR